MPLGVFAHPLNELSDGLFGRAAAADFRHLLRHPGIFIWVLLQELQRFPEAPELGLFDRGAVALRRGTPDICFRHRRQVRGSTGARVRTANPLGPTHAASLLKENRTLGSSECW